jgi:hypothetical protein
MAIFPVYPDWGIIVIKKTTSKITTIWRRKSLLTTTLPSVIWLTIGSAESMPESRKLTMMHRYSGLQP